MQKTFNLKSILTNRQCYRHLSCTFLKWPSYQVFNGTTDIYNGLTIDSKRDNCKKETFNSDLEESLEHWSGEGKKCIWFKIHIEDSDYVPILAKKGFNFHHARDEFVTMYKWLPLDLKPNLPPTCHTNLGVGALVLNLENQLLAVSEKNYDYPHWKLPGGYVEKGEDIKDAAVREVKEETGVDAEFVSLITFRHSHNMMYGNSDIYMLLLMKALSDNIRHSQREIRNCQWMDIDEYINHQHVHEFNKLIVNRALDYRKRNLKLDIQHATVKWPKYTREMNFLTITNYVK